MFGDKRYKAGQLVTLGNHVYRIKKGSLLFDEDNEDEAGVCCKCFFFNYCTKGKLGPCGYKIGLLHYFVLVR